MSRSLKNAAVVITGASSGIGRATARRFAARGANLVLAARRADALADVAQECRKAGAEAIVVPVDVADEASVRELADAAVREYGRIDVWVNNAAVGALGRIEDIPLEDFHRVMDVNVFGYVHGARAALPVFRRQDEGTLINVGSLLSRVSAPYNAPYVMSKHAVRALGMVLRQELDLAGAKNIAVSTVLPATIDTPFFQHAANYTGSAVRAMPPIYTPELVARTIVRSARRPRRERFAGNAARMVSQQSKVIPGSTERSLATMTDKKHLDKKHPEGPTAGTLYAPDELSDIHGGWHGRRKTAVRRLTTLALVGGGVAFARRRERKNAPRRRPRCIAPGPLNVVERLAAVFLAVG